MDWARVASELSRWLFLFWAGVVFELSRVVVFGLSRGYIWNEQGICTWLSKGCMWIELGCNIFSQTHSLFIKMFIFILCTLIIKLNFKIFIKKFVKIHFSYSGLNNFYICIKSAKCCIFRITFQLTQLVGCYLFALSVKLCHTSTPN